MNTIITIGRQYGSGGHEIGENLAKSLGIAFYDKSILTEAAKDSGLCEEMIKMHDERATNSFLYNLVMDTYSYGISSASSLNVPMSQKVFMAQTDAIKKIAEKGPCVIIGRCSDYVLSSMKNVLNVFIHAPEDTKIARIRQLYPDISESKARDMMKSKDKQRQSYYNYYTSNKWGRAETYHLCIDSHRLGTDGSVELLKQYIALLEK